MGCGCKGAKSGQVTKYEVRPNSGPTIVVDDMATVRRTLALGGGGSWKAVQVSK